jgi:hypothetical protein
MHLMANAKPMENRVVQAVAYSLRGALLWTLLVVASRLPLVGGIFPDNYGISTDADAQGVAITALRWWHEGIYTPSRNPGYFVSEMVNALFYPVGWWGANLFWSFIYGLSCCIYARLLLLIGVPHAFWVLVAYSFFPLMVVENASITEYTLSNSLLVLGWYAVMRGKPVASGVWVGCAIAARISQTPIALPIFALTLWTRTKRWQAGIAFCVIAALVACALWLIPMRLFTGSWNFLSGGVWQGSLLWRILAIGYDLYRAFGLLAMALCALYLITGLPNLIRYLRANPLSIPFWMSLLAFAIIVMQPNKPGYALIMVPYLYPLLASFRSWIPFPWVVVGTLSFLLVAIPYVEYSKGGVVVRWVGAGKIAQELSQRQREWRMADVLLTTPPERSMVLMGSRLFVHYKLYLSQHERKRPPVRVYMTHIHLQESDTWLIGFPRPYWKGVGGTDPKAGERFLQELLQQGYRVYYMPDMRYFYEDLPWLLEDAQPFEIGHAP